MREDPQKTTTKQSSTPRSTKSVSPAKSPFHGNPTPWRTAATLLLVGQGFSLLGSTIVQYAISWWIVMQTNSGLSTTLALVAGTLPAALISPLAGLWADRRGRKFLVIAPDVFIAAVTMLLAAGFATGHVSQWAILLVLVLRSLGAGVQTPAVQAFIPDIVPDEGLLRVNSINGVIEAVNMLAMPAVAAALLAVLPLQGILLIDVATALIGVLLVALIRVPRPCSAGRTESPCATTVTGDEESSVCAKEKIAGKQQDGTVDTTHRNAEDTARNIEETPDAGRSRAEGRGPDQSAADLLGDLKDGFSYAWRHPQIRLILLTALVVCFANTAVMNLTLLLINRVWNSATLVLGPMRLTSASAKLAADQTAFSVGMLVGGAVLSWRGSRLRISQMLLLALSVIGMGAGTILLSIAPSLLAYLVIDFLIGVVTSFASAPMYTLLQSGTDEHMRGRVFGLLTTFSSLGTPIGSMVFGPLADLIDVRWVFVIGGLLTLPVGIALLRAARATSTTDNGEARQR
jgi:DHA3 family macrolide efflux protein-like MFS transporter